MSFYWQQGLPQQDTGQSAQQPQQGQWDFINLGGAPASQQQWNPAAQQQQNNTYYQQQQPTNQHQYNVQQQPQMQQYNGHYPQHQEPQAQQQWAQQTVPQVQHQPQLSKPKKVQQAASIEHTPLLPPAQQVQVQQTAPEPQPQNHQNFTPAPPVLTPHQAVDFGSQQPQQQQQYYQQPPQQTPQQQQFVTIENSAPPQPAYFPPPPVAQFGSEPPSKEVTPEPAVAPSAPPAPSAPSKKVQKNEELIVAAPIVVEQPKTKVTPTSSEDDWEKADMEIQRVDAESKRQKAAAVAEKPEESRESSSLGGSWSQQDSQPSERNSVEPVEIVEHPESIEEQEEKTPRVSMSENTELSAHLTNTTATLHDKTLDVQQGNVTIPRSSLSPMEAVATSTPKDIKPDRKSSVTSQPGDKNAKSKPLKVEHANSPSPFTAPHPPAPKSEEHANSGNNSDSTMASGRPEFERGTARASYREYKKTYMEICDRLKIMRTDGFHGEFRPSSKLGNPLLAVAGLSRHPAIRRESLTGRNDGRASVPLHHSQSYTENMYPEHNGNGRRSRVSRLDPNARPNSRQASGYRPNISYAEPQIANHHDQQMYMQQQNYRQGRHSAMANPMGYDPRRAHAPYSYPDNFAHEPQETSSLSESDDGDENGEIDDEVRAFNMRQHHHQPQVRRPHPQNHHHHHQHQHQHPHHAGEEDAAYHCGLVQFNFRQWYRIKENFEIPAKFYDFEPVEKAAFMYYAVLFKQPHPNAEAFHHRFRRDFHNYTWAGDSEDDAFYKICQAMQQTYLDQKRKQELEYQNMKATLFSDDTSLDGQSEINSVNEEASNAGDNNGPMKFTCPHSFMHISTGGQIISIQPDQSISAVVFDDIKSVLKDVPTLQVREAAMTFKGPLDPSHSAPHSVRLYISKQIENIRRSAVAMENPEANDVVESLLVWQLLETMVKQKGNISGPDIAELLAKVASEPVNIEAPPQPSNITPALNQFTQFLLGGHIDEAVESAMRNGLFADALVLTRRLFPNDPRRIEVIESKFLETRSLNNPVTTLVSVAKGEVPPVLTNPTMDDHLSWRTHAAIILANLDHHETARNTIYQLGRALAKKDYHCAADFCFLVCHVLGASHTTNSINPFESIQTPEGEEDYRRHISLINSDLPDNETNPICQYGFLLSDLHATEIFDYALRLKPDRESPLGKSVEYQTARIKYAKLLANHGFPTDAYKYCMDVARTIWSHTNLFNPVDLLEMCDLAESLHVAACIDSSQNQWVQSLRSTAEAMLHPAPMPSSQQHATIEEEHDPENGGYGTEPTQEFRTEQVPSKVEVSTPTAFSPVVEYNPPAHDSTQYNIKEEPLDVPPTPEYHPEQTPQYESPFSVTTAQSQPQHQQQFDDGFTTPPDFNDGPLTMATSAPALPPQAEESVASPPSSTPNPAPQDPSEAGNQQSQQQQGSQNQRGGWMQSIQHTVQRATGQNPMNLPEDNNPSIVWDPAQNKYVGAGVEQEPTAPPPPTMAAAPPAPQVQGGGLRAARGASRYAKVGLGSSSGNSPAAPAGMMPMAPPTASFGFMPAPVDDDNDSVDPFSGQANPTIQQTAQLPAND